MFDEITSDLSGGALEFRLGGGFDSGFFAGEDQSAVVHKCVVSSSGLSVGEYVWDNFFEIFGTDIWIELE